MSRSRSGFITFTLLALWIASALLPLSISAADSQVALSAEERLWLSDHGEIAIGVDGAWPPIDFVDEQGHHRGIAADFLRLIGERLGVRFKIHSGPTFKDMLGKVMSGELKVGSTISIKPDRAEHLLFSNPFFDVRYTIHTRRDIADIREIGDLIGRKVAVEDGFFLMGKLEEDHPDIELMPVKDTLEALQAVSWGKADAYIGNQAVAQWLAQEAQLTNLKSVADSGYKPNPQRFAIHKDPAWKPLIGILNKALASISTEERQEIHQRWIGSLARGIADDPSSLVSAKEQSWLQAHPQVRLGVDPNWPPTILSIRPALTMAYPQISSTCCSPGWGFVPSCSMD